jgi:hypothetical protein
MFLYIKISFKRYLAFFFLLLKCSKFALCLVLNSLVIEPYKLKCRYCLVTRELHRVSTTSRTYSIVAYNSF